ncbi:MAG: hypothetical protein LC798_10875 [Chloroflexi bacterium]|nr:hypothetical protein [Chloroflexota bacterium]
MTNRKPGLLARLLRVQRELDDVVRDELAAERPDNGELAQAKAELARLESIVGSIQTRRGRQV